MIVAAISPSAKRRSTAKATGRGSHGNTSDAASSRPWPPARRTFATPGQVQPGQPSPSASAAKSRTRSQVPAARPPLGSHSAAPAAAPAASSSRRLMSRPGTAALLRARVPAMAVTDFDTKVAVVVRDDLATWQALNVTAFLTSGITARAGAEAIGEPYVDADGREYLPLLVQPVLVFAAGAAKLQTVRERAERRDVAIALYTAEMFETGNDADNRAAVRAVATAELDIVGVALRAPHRDADA